MATNREQTAAPGGDGAPPAGAPAEAPPPAQGGGFKAWLPLIIALLAMPGIAFVSTRFLIVPQLKKAAAEVQAEPSDKGDARSKSEKGEKGDGEKSGAKEGKAADGKPGPQKILAKIKDKMVVNLSGSLGTRFLMTSVTFVVANKESKDVVENNADQLVDLTTGTLSSKTITDLERPGARNILKTELISVYNSALGGAYIQDIYFTDFAIQ